MCMTQEASMDLMSCIIVIRWGAFRQESSTIALGVCVCEHRTTVAFTHPIVGIITIIMMFDALAVLFHFDLVAYLYKLSRH